jgi:hypothetical protein
MQELNSITAAPLPSLPMASLMSNYNSVPISRSLANFASLSTATAHLAVLKVAIKQSKAGGRSSLHFTPIPLPSLSLSISFLRHSRPAPLAPLPSARLAALAGTLFLLHLALSQEPPTTALHLSLLDLADATVAASG